MRKVEETLQSMQRLFSAQETASYLGVSHDTVRRLAHLGELPVVKIVRGFRFDRQDVDKYIARQKEVV